MKRRLVLFCFLLTPLIFASNVKADQVGGEEIYGNFWRFGESITIDDCVGLIKYKRFGFTRMGEAPDF